MSDDLRATAARLGIQTDGTDIDIETGRRFAPEPDDLTAQIAGVLAEHQQAEVYRDARFHCMCGWISEQAVPYAWVAHQAEQVRADLGETTTEWGVQVYADGSVTAFAPEDHARNMAVRFNGALWTRTRTVTPWVEVPRG